MVCARTGGLVVSSLMSQHHAGVSQGGICSDRFTRCHTEIEIAEQTVYLTQSQCTDTRLTSPSSDPTAPGAWQGSRWSANLYVTGMTRPGKLPIIQVGIEPIVREPSLCTSTRTLFSIIKFFSLVILLPQGL